MVAISSRNRVNHPKNDEFYTPKFIFDALNLSFDLDPASPENNLGCVPANEKYTIKDNGLEKKWHGLIWLNPPFSKAAPWVEKFMEHKNGIALLPVSKAKWFEKIWVESDVICLLPTRFHFDRPDDLRSDIFMRTILAGVGKIAKTSLLESNLGKCR